MKNFCSFLVLCAYFTMRDIEITLTHDKKNLPSRNHPLATLYAQGNDKHLRYSINGTHGYLEINVSTGDIFLTNKFFESNLTGMILKIFLEINWRKETIVV